jgi:hypothetical protein
LVVTERTLSMSTSLAASTVAFATTAPLVSLTTPEIVLWAEAEEDNSTRATRPTNRYVANLAFMHLSYFIGTTIV